MKLLFIAALVVVAYAKPQYKRPQRQQPEIPAQANDQVQPRFLQNSGPKQTSQGNSEPIPILRYDNEGVNPDGTYQWSFESANGISQQEQGQLKDLGAGQEPANEVQGSSSYTSDDGTPISLTYIANENGFQPQGTHLPTPPSVPPAIVRLLEWLQAHPESEEEQKKYQ